MQVATQKQEAKHKGLIEFYRFREVYELFSSGLRVQPVASPVASRAIAGRLWSACESS